jgi:hypothetical protein
MEFDPSNYIALLDIVGIGRILFGLIFLAKIYVSYRANVLVWSHNLPFASSTVLKLALIFLLLSLVCFTIGIFTPVSAFLVWLSYVFIYKYASLYGLEDVSFQHMAFYFVLGSGNSSFRIDNLLEINLFGRLGAENGFLPEVFLAIALGYIFLSAGFEKLYSPMWQKGLGAYYFYLMPQFRRLDTSFITNNYFISVTLNWLAVIMELFLLPVFLLNAVPLGLFFWILGFGFTSCLSSIFILTWIGECLSIGMLIVLWLLFKAGSTGLFVIFIAEFNTELSKLEILFSLIVCLSFIASFFTVFVRRDSQYLAKSNFFKKFYASCRYVSRYIWGLLPLKVFTENHVEGPVVYRTFAKFKNQTQKEVFKIFTEDSRPGIERPYRPAFFEVTSYKIAEACMELDEFSEISSAERKEFINNLATYIKSRLTSKEQLELQSIKFIVKQIKMPDDFVGSNALYVNDPWVEAIRVDFAEDNKLTISRLNEQILKYPTGRNIKRLSFKFNPLDA